MVSCVWCVSYLVNVQLPFRKIPEDKSLSISFMHPRPKGSFWHVVCIHSVNMNGVYETINEGRKEASYGAREDENRIQCGVRRELCGKNSS